MADDSPAVNEPVVVEQPMETTTTMPSDDDDNDDDNDDDDDDDESAATVTQEPKEPGPTKWNAQPKEGFWPIAPLSCISGALVSPAPGLGFPRLGLGQSDHLVLPKYVPAVLTTVHSKSGCKATITNNASAHRTFQ